MNDAEALAVGTEAVEEALNRNGDNKVLAAEDLKNQASADGRLKEALKRVGVLELQSEQAVKH
ncbi:hypothetical protein M3795_16750 [Ralstonia pickettii]|jgi:hypothetical protein|uniref:Uncharacterized protein n=1 Tax=Ralstonia pickettii OR214 TaxID=1264675 RepID=R0E1T3_RALPI|nr:hypothetical protein [Ralstonia pickettii]ENZ79598.1 hypothetical protein OR214_00014 [Ralstonia pickettii OR214]MCM3582134.1 hypothetical protein [Ralstonia pickettii]